MVIGSGDSRCGGKESTTFGMDTGSGEGCVEDVVATYRRVGGGELRGFSSSEVKR